MVIHDMFANKREVHHQLAYKYVVKADDKFLSKLCENEILTIAYAVLQHRASFKGEYYSELSKLISSADRGNPDLDKIVIRSMKFNGCDAYKVFKHISNKYGSNGYARYPQTYIEFFKDELNTFKKLADEITPERVMEIWENRD